MQAPLRAIVSLTCPPNSTDELLLCAWPCYRPCGHRSQGPHSDSKGAGGDNIARQGEPPRRSQRAEGAVQKSMSTAGLVVLPEKHRTWGGPGDPNADATRQTVRNGVGVFWGGIPEKVVLEGAMERSRKGVLQAQGLP